MTAQAALAFGLGLRTDHYEEILASRPEVEWFEALTENYLVPGGKPLHYLDRIRADFPMVLHGVSLSVGSHDALDREYLKALKQLAQRVEPAWVSDHLCWTGVFGRNLHDLFPLPYTEEAAGHVAARVREVQDFLGRQILLENVSTYVTFRQSEMSEWEFLSEVCARADCLILLDINNIYVSAYNHGFDPKGYLDAIPPERVSQYHLAGHTNKGTHIIDTHNDHVIDAVWDLYRRSVARTGNVSTLLEWDADIPAFDVVHAEALKARAHRAEENTVALAAS